MSTKTPNLGCLLRTPYPTCLAVLVFFVVFVGIRDGWDLVLLAATKAPATVLIVIAASYGFGVVTWLFARTIVGLIAPRENDDES